MSRTSRSLLTPVKKTDKATKSKKDRTAVLIAKELEAADANNAGVKWLVQRRDYKSELEEKRNEMKNPENQTLESRLQIFSEIPNFHHIRDSFHSFFAIRHEAGRVHRT